MELENDLKEQVSRNLGQSEIVEFMTVKYPIFLARGPYSTVV